MAEGFSLDRVLGDQGLSPIPRHLSNVDDRLRLMTIPFGEPEPSDALLNKSVSSTRLRSWLNNRLRHLAFAQRIQDARALRGEFLVEDQ
ncbi:MAG: hypothetical protein CL681_01665 [Blastopirellula sp.]|nr:hypothetical protein [Blastopirellula sp.]MAR08666.1 hypothetical protein [Blastopirellula sp.]